MTMRKYTNNRLSVHDAFWVPCTKYKNVEMQDQLPKELTSWHEDKPSTLEPGVVLCMSRQYEATLHLIEGHIFIYTRELQIQLMYWK